MLSFYLCSQSTNHFLTFIVVIFASINHCSSDSSVGTTAEEVETSTNSVTSPDNKDIPQYQFAYKITHDDSSEQGHQLSNTGVKSSGQYFVNLAGGEKHSVNYYTDEQGYHPIFNYHSESSQSHFKFGDQVKPLNVSDLDKYEVNFESQSGRLNTDNTGNYATPPSQSTTESILSNEVNTALPSTKSESVIKISRGEAYTPSDQVRSSTEQPYYSSTSPTSQQQYQYSASTESPIYETSASSTQSVTYSPSTHESSRYTQRAATEATHYKTPEISSPSLNPSTLPNAKEYGLSSTTPEYEEENSSLRYNILEPNLPQSQLFVSSERQYSTVASPEKSSEKPLVKIYPSTPGMPTTVPNVFYVNAQSNFNSTSAMLDGFETYLKDYLNSNELKSNDIESNFKLISDKNELDKLIKNAGEDYEIIKLSDIMAEKQKKQSDSKIADTESTTQRYAQIQQYYTQIPSTFSTHKMEIISTTAKVTRNSEEKLGLMKYYEGTQKQAKNDAFIKNEKETSGTFQNENSFQSRQSTFHSIPTERSIDTTFSSKQFSSNFGDKIATVSNPTQVPYSSSPYDENVSVNYNPSSAYTVEPNYNTVSTGPSTENYSKVTNTYNENENMGKNKEAQNLRYDQLYAYYKHQNGEDVASQEQIYFNPLQSDTNTIKSNAPTYYSGVPVQLLKGSDDNILFSQFQNSAKQGFVYNKQVPVIFNQQDPQQLYKLLPLPDNAPVNNLGYYQNIPNVYHTASNNFIGSTTASLQDKPIIVPEMNITSKEDTIVSLSNGESGHIPKAYEQSPVDNSGSTAGDIEVAKVDQLNPTTPKTITKKDTENNKVEEGSVEQQKLYAMPTHITTIEVFKSVPVEQYVVPDVQSSSFNRDIPSYNHLTQETSKNVDYHHSNLGSSIQQGPIAKIPYSLQNTSPYPFEQPIPLQKTRLQPVHNTQILRQSFFRANPNFNNEQKYYTDNFNDVRAPHSNQGPVPIPLNYGLNEKSTGHMAYRTPLVSSQLKSIQQYGVPQYSMFTSPLEDTSMPAVHPSYSISVNPLPLNQVQQQMVSNSIPYASQFYPHYLPFDSSVPHGSPLNSIPQSGYSQNTYHQPEKAYSVEIQPSYSYPKPKHPLEYPAKQAYNHKTRLVPVAQHFHIPTTILHLVRTPYQSTFNKAKPYYNPNESHYLKEMYNYAPQYYKENYRFDGHHPQNGETIHNDGRSKHAPFRPSFPMYDSVYPSMQYFETQYMAPNSNGNVRRPHGRVLQTRQTSGNNKNMKKLVVEYGGFKPPMVPSTEIKDGDVQTQVTEK